MQIQKTVGILNLNQFPKPEVLYIVSGYMSSNKKKIFFK